MNRILSTILVLCATLMANAAKFDETVTITINGETREYWLYVPDKVSDNAPLVLSLHGAGGHDYDKSPFRTDAADLAKYIVAYPQGKMTTFPGLGGAQNYGWSAYGEENFDTEFLKAVIEDVASKYSIDRKRIYCCGFSNGGMMTYVMANTCSNIFAAYASISGYPINEFHLHHTGGRPVPFLHIHGKEDDFVRYSLVGNVIDNIVARNGANPVPKKTTRADKYNKSVYAAGDGGFPVIFYEIDGMGHNDFTDKTELGSSALTMWKFFSQYTLDSKCDSTLKWSPRIETEGFDPTAHGFVMNQGNTILQFGGDQNTSANQNVYRSLQFTDGDYKLGFHAEATEDTKITVKLRKLSGNKRTVLNETLTVDGDVTLPFSVTDGWGEYQLTVTRVSGGNDIKISNLLIRSDSDDATGLTLLRGDNNSLSDDDTRVFCLQGQYVGDVSQWQTFPKGIYIVGGQKVLKF